MQVSVIDDRDCVCAQVMMAAVTQNLHTRYEMWHTKLTSVQVVVAVARGLLHNLLPTLWHILNYSYM